MGAFNQFGDVRVKNGRRHIYIDRGSNVLAVAHADSVQQYRGFSYSDTVLRCATIDNRLGLYLALFHLSTMGIKCDVLITDGEERGNSSAQDFEPDKEYNWTFSFDRMGNDMVMYQYEDDETGKLMESYGFDVGFGSYSDISELEHLKCKGFNFGCGMQNYHATNAYADLSDLNMNLSLFANFYADMSGERLAHTQTARYSRYSRYGLWEDYDYGSTYKYDAATKSWVKSSGTSTDSGWWKKPIRVGNHYYNYDWPSERYRRWNHITNKYEYLGATPETENLTEADIEVVSAAEQRDAERDLWDWSSETGLIGTDSAQEVYECVGCGYEFLRAYVAVLEGDYYCDECLRYALRSESKYRECDDCGALLPEKKLNKWNESVLCGNCYAYEDKYGHLRLRVGGL